MSGLFTFSLLSHHFHLFKSRSLIIHTLHLNNVSFNLMFPSLFSSLALYLKKPDRLSYFKIEKGTELQSRNFEVRKKYRGGCSEHI